MRAEAGVSMSVAFKTEKSAKVAVRGIKSSLKVILTDKKEVELGLAIRRVEKKLKSLLELIDRAYAAQRNWTELVCSGRVKPDLNFDQALWDLFATLRHESEAISTALSAGKKKGLKLANSETFIRKIAMLRDDMHGLNRPTRPVRGITREEVQRLSSVSVAMSRYDD